MEQFDRLMLPRFRCKCWKHGFDLKVRVLSGKRFRQGFSNPVNQGELSEKSDINIISGCYGVVWVRIKCEKRYRLGVPLLKMVLDPTKPFVMSLLQRVSRKVSIFETTFTADKLFYCIILGRFTDSQIHGICRRPDER